MIRQSVAFAALAIAGATFVAVVILGIALGPASPVGDESEYFAMTYALATSGSPTLTPAVVSSIQAAPPVSVKAIDGSSDALHFWFFSALASPFLWLCKAIGINWKHCYVFVNALTFATAVGIAAYYFTMRAAVLLLIGLSASPLFPYLNKAHPEAFSVSLLAIALVFLAQKRPLAAALTLSIISAQVTAFSPVVVILLIYWAAGLGTAGRTPTRIELVIAAGCCCLLALQPLWTLWRHHTLNLIVAAGYVKPELISLRRILGMLIDPDVGLLLSWPAGAVLATLVVVGLWRDFGLLQKRPVYWIVVAGLTGYLCVIGAQQTGYTTGIPRYSLWFLPLCLVSLLLVYESERERTRGFATAIAVVCITVSFANLYYTAKLTGFEPALVRRPQAELWYRLLPAVYDPEEQVFTDYALGEPRAFSYELFVRGRYPLNKLGDPHTWALSNKACTKLLVFAYAFTSSQVSLRLPWGCREPLDPAQLLAYARRGNGPAMRDRYVNISERDLHKMRLPAFAPTPSVPANQAPRVESVAAESRTASTITYVLRVSDPDGWQDIDSAFLTIAGAGCYIVYNQPRNALVIANALATDRHPRAETLSDGIPGRPGALRGEHCGINPANVTVSGAGESLTLTVPVSLDPPFMTAPVDAGVTDFAQSAAGSAAASYLFAAPPNAAPDLRLVSEPDRLKVSLHPGPDFSNITYMWILINDRLDPSHACYIGVARTRVIRLTTDDTDAAPAIDMGEERRLENSQCAIDGRDSTLTTGTDGLQLSLHVMRKPSFLTPKRIWAGYQDESGKTKTWREIGAL